MADLTALVAVARKLALWSWFQRSPVVPGWEGRATARHALCQFMAVAPIPDLSIKQHSAWGWGNHPTVAGAFGLEILFALSVFLGGEPLG